jgi:hypothetical protein
MLCLLITKPNNKQIINEIIDFVGNSPALFEELMEYFVNGSSRVMHFMLDYNEAIAIRAFSMRICDRISLKYPELISELLYAIRSILPGASSGLKNRG